VVRGTCYDAVIKSEIQINGSNNLITGLKFSGPDATIRLSGTGNRVERNLFRDWTSIAINLRSGRNGTVAYNEFHRPHRWGHSSDGSYPLRIAIRSSDKDGDFYTGAKIRRNHFHDFPAKPNPRNYHSGQSDAIEICYTGSLKQSGFLIEYNLIERHYGTGGVIDMKCGGATVQFNTLVNAPDGRIDLRNGRNTTMRANWIQNAGGTRTHGYDHTLIGNVYRNTVDGIAVGGGNSHWTAEQAKTPQSRNIKLIQNKADVVSIGLLNTGHKLPAIGTKVIGNQGSKPRLLKETGTTFSAYTGGAVPKAIRLKASQVGLRAACNS